MRSVARTPHPRRSATTRSSTRWWWPRPRPTSRWSRSTPSRAADLQLEQRRLLHLLRAARLLRLPRLLFAPQVQAVAQVAPALDRALADHLAEPLLLALR